MRNIICQQLKKIKSNLENIPPVIPPITNNQIEEITYFSAYILPLTEKANLQTALNTYGSVRLEQGDYSGTSITMTSNQKLYGHPRLNLIPAITLVNGSTNVHIENVMPTSLTLQSGGVISGCTFKSIRYSSIIGTNIMFENNTLINILQTRININCSGSGYIRNNKIIRHQVQSNQINLVLKGNSATPSYGNVHLHTNFLTPTGDTTDLDNLQSATFVGLDSEGWNLTGSGTKAMLYGRNLNTLNVTDFGGGNGYSAVILPAFDIDAQNFSFINRGLAVTGDVISPSTNMFINNAINGTYLRSAGTQTGFDYKAFCNDKKVNYNGVDKTSLITGQDAINITNSILKTEYTPWSQPTFETLPDPLGANWRTERIGKSDSRAYIQNLINNNNVAELPEGIFYIGGSLVLPLDDLHGIQGQGTGKTVICGLTDDFPLIRVSSTKNGSWHINNLTLQGGNAGVYVEKIVEGDAGQVRFMNTKFVIFRDTNYGIHTYHIQGMDNCFFNNIAFVNCIKGYYQEPIYPSNGNYTTSYVDKVVFYKSQFINCETAFSMIATRADNLNAWIDCKFDGGQRALDMAGQNFPIVANCHFTNYLGSNIIKSNTMSIYNSIFNNNSSAATINVVRCNIEGSQFLDNEPVFSYVTNNAPRMYILNSIFNGDIIVPDNGQSYTYPSAIYINNLFNVNPTLSKLLVKIEDKIPTVLLDAIPTPYPQLLVTQ